MAIYFLIGLLPRTIEITLKSVVRFLVACLVSELLNDKDTRYPPSCFIISILMTSQNFCFQKLFNLCKKYRYTNPAIFNIAHLSYVLLRENKFYPACDVMDFLHIQDGGWLISFSFNISKVKHAIKNLKADFTVISIVLSDKPIKKYVAISL